MIIPKLFCAACLLLLISVAASAQSKPKPLQKETDSSFAGRAATIVIGSAAKAGWETTKFAAKRIAKPVAKTLIVKGGPKAAIFMLKSSGMGAKYLLPWAIKLSLL